MMFQTAFAFDFAAAPEALEALTVVDLCCGCGMASLGLVQAGLGADGFEVLSGVDIWEDAVEAFYLNHSNNVDFYRDAGWMGVEEAVDGRQADFRVDVVLTGPPCQDDSRANQGVDKGRGKIKAPTLETARELGATWIIMEMVTSEYVSWCREQGARQILKLRDCDLGGYTSRIRWFAIWGPRDLEIETAEPRGWGEALDIAPELLEGALLASESNNKSKRWRLARTPDQPASACVGGDRRHILRLADGREFRLGPADEAALSGFPQLRLSNTEWVSDETGTREWTYGAQNERQANTMVGNGWPCSFGKALGQAILKAEGR